MTGFRRQARVRCRRIGHQAISRRVCCSSHQWRRQSPHKMSEHPGNLSQRCQWPYLLWSLRCVVKHSILYEVSIDNGRVIDLSDRSDDRELSGHTNTRWCWPEPRPNKHTKLPPLRAKTPSGLNSAFGPFTTANIQQGVSRLQHECSYKTLHLPAPFLYFAIIFSRFVR